MDQSMHSLDGEYPVKNGPPTRELRGRIATTEWERPVLIILLVLTAVAYIYGLNQSGWSNSFYSAAVQAATKSWKAFFFGSIDASNFITVDKPPASLWVMAISARIFGLNSWSILIPEAIEGVLCVWVLYLTVRRWFSPAAALLSGLVLAMTPVAALMFRFNNPDALLVLLLTVSTYFFTRALEDGKTKWLVWASVLVGFAFLTKMLAAFFVIPVYLLVYLVFGPVAVRKRISQLIISAVSVLISAGWWVAIVQLTPAADRPYIGSSQTNSILNLIFGYNGIGRLTGNKNGFGGGNHGGGGMFGGSPGLWRLFESRMGGQISWLIPAALILFIISVWFLRQQWKTEKAMPALLLWAGIFVVTGVVFSFGSGTIHEYYTVALAPSIAALIGISAEILWLRRDQWIARIGLALSVAASAAWAFVLLDRSPTWYPALRVALVIIGGLAALAIVFGPILGRHIVQYAAIAGLFASLAGPLAYTIQTIGTPHTGSSPTAGPNVNGGNFRNGFAGMQGHSRFKTNSNTTNGKPATGFGGPNSSSNSNTSAKSNTTNQRGFGTFGGGGAPGGLGGDNATTNTALVSLLKQNASSYKWVAATVGAQSSASYQLASGLPLMDIGGFTGSDPTPTLTQFKTLVSEGKIHYYIGGRMGGHGGGFGSFNGWNPNAGGTTTGSSSNNAKTSGTANGTTSALLTSANPMTRTSSSNSQSNGNNPRGGFGGRMGGFGNNSQISTWVSQNFTAKTVGGVTVYDLTQSKSN